ncbi:hypothetical protein SAMN06265219_103151 [Gracilimonas mengyeensis]|uniref:YceI-like domain-containing protein n=1 Tax=Gracilimonas mengyeensis TaxID=1302730 RepID=A0A521BVN2_9BACT|nr:hypothetical protein SAMN06265219_103151 [Gracilimonas mengyeensis]
MKAEGHFSITSASFGLLQKLETVKGNGTQIEGTISVHISNLDFRD